MTLLNQLSSSFISESVTLLCCKRIKVIFDGSYHRLNGNLSTRLVHTMREPPTQSVLRTLSHIKLLKPKKPYTSIEQLVLPCAKEMVKLVGEDAARRLDDFSVSNDSVSRRIKISQNINGIFVDEIKKVFLLHNWMNQTMFRSILTYWCLRDMYLREISRKNFYFVSLLKSILEL